MKKILVLTIAICFLVTGCGQARTKETNLKHEGIIVEIMERNQMLVVSNITEEDISNKERNELLELARKNGGDYAYYSFNIEEYEGIEVGAQVIVYWNGNQLDSDPPQRGVKKLKILSN